MKFKGLENFPILGLLALLYLSPTAISIYYNKQFKDLGEGFSYVEFPKTRRFYDEKRARVYFDNNKDGTLDTVAINMPMPQCLVLLVMRSAALKY